MDWLLRFVMVFSTTLLGFFLADALLKAWDKHKQKVAGPDELFSMRIWIPNSAFEVLTQEAKLSGNSTSQIARQIICEKLASEGKIEQYIEKN